MTDYFKPRSLTFWAGVFSILSGVALGIHENAPFGWWMDAIVSVLGPASSPAILVSQGLGLIGIRRKMDDMY